MGGIRFNSVGFTTPAEVTQAELDAATADIAVMGEQLNLLTNSATDQSATIQTAIDNIESQGGGRVLLPATDRSGLGITISDLVYVRNAVDILGQGKRGTKFRCNQSDAGLHFIGSDDSGYTGSTNRGGESGNFHVDGNNTATTPVTVRSTNRLFKDIRISTPANNGKAMYINSAQNCNFVNVEGEDGSHTSSRRVRGIVLDGGAAGLKFDTTSLNEFTDGHVVFDGSYDATEIDYCNNIMFVNNMIERTDSGLPIISIKCGNNINFTGGNIATGEDFVPTTDYAIVQVDNSAARGLAGGGSAPTRGIEFDKVSFTGSLNGSTRWANVLQCESDLSSWHDAVLVTPSCTYSNCNYLARIEGGTVIVRAHGAADSSGGGLVGWTNPAGVGKINTRIAAGASTTTVKSTCDYYEVSGNTNINSFSATYAGHRIVVKFGGTPTVSSSAGNIKLSGLVDMSATADDLLCLICDGTNWHETSRVVK